MRLVFGISALLAALLAATSIPLAAAPPLRVLLIDGQNNHKWQETTPVLKRELEETGLFQVDVLTSPPAGADMSGFRPEFARYQVVVSNYNGDPWPEAAKRDFEKYVSEGGGFVSYHAADNAFPEWEAYNEMIGVGGWGNRTEEAGPFWYLEGGEWHPDMSPGKAGSHGARVPFLITMRNSVHPVAKGLPDQWMHAADELYSRLRGPGQKVTLLATAYSDPGNRGTGHDEPMLMAITYGKGRVFHTTLGHDVTAIRGVGFIVTFQRGTEWAATGKVTQPVPADFPSAKEEKSRP